MIEKMSESIFESTLPLTVEQFGSSPLINYPLTLSDEIKVEEDSFLADDHWKKFELDFPELSDIDDIFKELDNGGFNSWQWNTEPSTKDDVFLNHDCMWAGHCGSKEHSEEAKLLSCMAPPQPPIIKQEMCPPPPVNTKAFAGQQSLLKPSVKAMNSTFVPATTTNMLHTPQTPPESDDEENKASNSLLKILNDAINECDLDEDNDLTEYFEGKEVEVKDEPVDIKEEIVLVEKMDEEEQEEEEDTESDEPEQEEMDYEAYRLRTQMAAENDHSYYKDKDSAMMRHSHYGLDTPSDSEDDEEIDVVSVSEKYTTTARIALSMPTNPSSRDKHQLQRRVATAMSRQRVNNAGIKTILPVVRNPEPQPSKPTSNRRGVKRGRNGRNNGGYKRRRTANKVIEEHEPADKRHLHNDMERQRRVDLRIAFDNLKAVVPEVSGTKKIAKVNILLQASQYCYYLTGSNANYTRQLEDLRKKQVELRAKVSQLRRNLAANR